MRKHLRFSYVNWKGEEHVYLVMPTTLAYKLGQWTAGEDLSLAWAMNAQVIERDGLPKPTMRTFRLDKMHNIEEVEFEEKNGSS